MSERKVKRTWRPTVAGIMQMLACCTYIFCSIELFFFPRNLPESAGGGPGVGAHRHHRLAALPSTAGGGVGLGRDAAGVGPGAHRRTAAARADRAGLGMVGHQHRPGALLLDASATGCLPGQSSSASTASWSWPPRCSFGHAGSSSDARRRRSSSTGRRRAGKGAKTR